MSFDSSLEVISYFCLCYIKVVFSKSDDICVYVVHVVKKDIDAFVVVAGADAVDICVVYLECRLLFCRRYVTHEFVVCG